MDTPALASLGLVILTGGSLALSLKCWRACDHLARKLRQAEEENEALRAYRLRAQSEIGDLAEAVSEVRKRAEKLAWSNKWENLRK